SFAAQHDHQALLGAVAQSARILFNIDDALILLWNHQTNALVGAHAASRSQRLAEFAVPLGQPGQIAKAALQRELTFVTRDGAPLNLPEEQLLRTMEANCLMCLPLAANERCLGVLVAGVAPWQAQYLQSRARFLRSFGIQASMALQNALRNAAPRQLGGDEQSEQSRRVIHEVNNPLAIIKNYLGVLAGKLSNDAAVSGEMAILNEEIDRVSSIINSLGKPEQQKPQGPTDINRVVREVVQLFRGSQLPDGIEIVTRLPDLPSEIEAAGDPVKQILLNLIKNAIEAMPHGGKIDINTNGRVHRDGAVYLELCVHDNGPGIPDHVLTHLFSPVRSNKAGANRGLGLSIVQGLVRDLRGLIGCRSGSSGTTFDLLLPLPDTTSANFVIAQAASDNGAHAPAPSPAPAAAQPALSGSWLQRNGAPGDR
ncbi:MAG TPA: ATP-binding protein, partial [Burkholderiaceae bacterium]